jgi:DNA-binding NarL/FixJ family response regulator
MIRIVLAEDQTIVRRGIATMLGMTGDIEVAGEAADGEEAVRVITAVRPDVALLDARMPKLSGPDALIRLREHGVAPPALILTTFDEDPVFLQAIQAGAKGFLLKDVSIERLADAIRALADGKTLLRPAITERVVKVVQAQGLAFQTAEKPDRLTPREQDVLRLIAAGYSNREVGEALKMAEGTVKNNISSILDKLGARDRTRAVLRGIELGYV